MYSNDFEELQSTWDKLAEEDPFWAILSMPSKKGRRWDVEEFFAEGEAEVERVVRKMNSLHPLNHCKALDFGCGVGRLTQPLAKHFDQVIGIDISSKMIDLARRFNRQGGGVEYVYNPHNDLTLFCDQTFDFVYSNLVLQHMNPLYAVQCINEFFRVTRHDGAIVFQIPSHLTDEYLPRNSMDAPLLKKVCRAQIAFVSEPKTLKPGEQAVLQVQVTNNSREEWLQGKTHPINVGNHWLRSDGCTVVANDDGRSRLPGRLPASKSVIVSLSIKAPDKPGKYYLEIDVVQEGIRWFKDAGSPTLAMPVRVEGSLSWFVHELFMHHGSVNAENARLEPPAFTMQGIPREDILAIISAAGARLLAIEESVKEWYSYKYYIAR